jgi:hypothetical protein
MIREYIECHKWNGIKWENNPNAGRKRCFMRGIIRCDGKEQAFASVGYTLKDAKEVFDTYLDENCICVYGSDVKKCPVHGKDNN